MTAQKEITVPEQYERTDFPDFELLDRDPEYWAAVETCKILGLEILTKAQFDTMPAHSGKKEGVVFEPKFVFGSFSGDTPIELDAAPLGDRDYTEDEKYDTPFHGYGSVDHLMFTRDCYAKRHGENNGKA